MDGFGGSVPKSEEITLNATSAWTRRIQSFNRKPVLPSGGVKFERYTVGFSGIKSLTNNTMELHHGKCDLMPLDKSKDILSSAASISTIIF